MFINNAPYFFFRSILASKTLWQLTLLSNCILVTAMTSLPALLENAGLLLIQQQELLIAEGY